MRDVRSDARRHARKGHDVAIVSGRPRAYAPLQGWRIAPRQAASLLVGQGYARHRVNCYAAIRCVRTRPGHHRNIGSPRATMPFRAIAYARATPRPAAVLPSAGVPAPPRMLRNVYASAASAIRYRPASDGKCRLPWAWSARQRGTEMGLNEASSRPIMPYRCCAKHSLNFDVLFSAPQPALQMRFRCLRIIAQQAFGDVSC